MTKLSKALKALGLILRQPSLLNHILDDEQVKRNEVVKKFGMGEGLPVVDIREFLPDEGMIIEPFAFLDGGCLPSDLALLKSLCIKNKVKDYLEIGTWRGESVCNVASLAENCISVDLPDEDMKALGWDKDYIEMHAYFSSRLKNVRHLRVNSHEYDFKSREGKFDLIFIDGDHHTESICKDTETAFKLLRDENSLIVWHDYALGPETPRFEVLQGILQACPEEEQKHLYHVSNTLCALYSRQPLPSKTLKANEEPDHYFQVEIKAREIS